MKTALVLGAGGFIGSHMVNRLESEGYWVRGVDLKHPEFSKSQADEFVIADLRSQYQMSRVVVDKFQEPFYESKTFDEVYQFAADMGGAGYIFTGEHDADIMHNSATINLNLLDELRKAGFKGKVFYSSSACMYPQEIQETTDNPGLKESHAYPANPDSEYGWEKLFSERLFLAYARNYNFDVRIARFHNIFGPEGPWKGGKEKAPAAVCRKVAEAKVERHRVSGFHSITDGLYGEIEIWGDGEQTRSFLYIDECIEGVRRLMQSNCKVPVNIGSDEMVSINQLADMVSDIASKPIVIKHDLTKPQGVRGRNSDNNFIYDQIGWKPTQPLKDGLIKTFQWINQQVNAN